MGSELGRRVKGEGWASTWLADPAAVELRLVARTWLGRGLGLGLTLTLTLTPSPNVWLLGPKLRWEHMPLLARYCRYRVRDRVRVRDRDEVRARARASARVGAHAAVGSCGEHTCCCCPNPNPNPNPSPNPNLQDERGHAR